MGTFQERENKKREGVIQVFGRKGKLGVSWYSDFFYKGKRYKKAWGRVPKTIAKEKD